MPCAPSTNKTKFTTAQTVPFASISHVLGVAFPAGRSEGENRHPTHTPGGRGNHWPVGRAIPASVIAACHHGSSASQRSRDGPVDRHLGNTENQADGTPRGEPSSVQKRERPAWKAAAGGAECGQTRSREVCPHRSGCFCCHIFLPTPTSKYQGSWVRNTMDLI